MNIVERVKNIIITPKTEWDVIASETTPTPALITGYVLPLVAISAIASFIGMSLLGSVFGVGLSLVWGLVMLVYKLVMAIVAVFVVAFIIDALAPTFGGTKSMPQALKVAAYSWTPGWVAGILLILPLLAPIVFLVSLYGVYLLYLGLPRLMKSPEEKSIGYTALVIVATIIVMAVIGIVGGMITGAAVIGGAALGGRASLPRYETRVDPSSPVGKLDAFSKKMEEAGKKMEAAEKSGDPNKQMEAAMGALGTALSGGKGVEPLQLDQIKPFVPDTFVGLPRTNTRSERSGIAGLMVAKAEGSYGDGSGKQVELEVVDTGGMAGLMGLASWVGVIGERETDDRMERTRKEGNRVIHEEVSKRGGRNTYALVLNDRFVVSAKGSGVDLNTLKSGVASLDIGKLEAIK